MMHRIFMLTLSAFVTLALGVASDARARDDLRLSDGSGFAVEGEFLGFDGEFIEIMTENGRLTLKAAGLECSGTNCPKPPIFEVSFSAPDNSSRRLLIGLIRSFATSDGQILSEVYEGSRLREINLTKNDNAGELHLRLFETGGEWRVLRGAGTGKLLAFDALAPVVAPDNPVTGLTLLSLRAAVSGEFSSWFGLGGDRVPVTVHWADELQRSEARRFEFRPAPDAIRHTGFTDAADALAEDPGGISVLPISEIGTGVPLVVTGSCGRGTLGVPDAIRTGDYPLSDVLVLQQPNKRAPPILRRFVDWLDGPTAAKAITDAGFVGLDVRHIRGVLDGRQEADAVSLSFTEGAATGALVSTLDGAKRLNVAMRFQDGSSLPDRRAQLQISRLANAIQTGVFEGKTLLLVGFSDADGSASTNLTLSRRRAEAIQNELVSRIGLARHGAKFEAIGLGEAMPVACNGVAWGERLNRRVEVWLQEP